jgi:hypothetical protein
VNSAEFQRSLEDLGLQEERHYKSSLPTLPVTNYEGIERGLNVANATCGYVKTVYAGSDVTLTRKYGKQ